MEVLPSGLPIIVEQEEDLARFLVWSSQFTSTTVKPSAFLPNPKDGQTSVFRHGSEPRTGLWRIAAEWVDGERTVRGVAIFKARHVGEAGLDVSSHEPPPRHANIHGWASLEPDPDLGKAERKRRAALIAQQAVLVLR